MNPRHASFRSLPAPGHARSHRTHRIRRAAALTATAMLAFVVAGAATAYTTLQGNITSAQVEHLLGDRPPRPSPNPTDPNAGTPVNILVIGSDTRAGNEEYGIVPGERSDTTIVLHISADRSRVELVSIPRDSLVDIPECMRSDGTTSRARSDAMFNEAFAIGAESGQVSDGAVCVQRTVEANTGVFLHHFLVVDMNGFTKMVDAIGGVSMCIPNDIESPLADLHLTAGQQTLDGRNALAFARARTGRGLTGSDLSRIARQQELLAATARTVLGMNVLTSVPELLRFLDATTESLTVSSGIGKLPDMAGLAYSVRAIRAEDITFMTIPIRTAPTNRNRVVWTEDAAQVWANIVADVPMTTGLFPETPVVTPSPGATDAPVQPAPTRTPGIEPFTPADVTSVCG